MRLRQIMRKITNDYVSFIEDFTDKDLLKEKNLKDKSL